MGPCLYTYEYNPLFTGRKKLEGLGHFFTILEVFHFWNSTTLNIDETGTS